MKYYEILCGRDTMTRDTLDEATGAARAMADILNQTATIYEVTSRQLAEIEPGDES